MMKLPFYVRLKFFIFEEVRYKGKRYAIASSWYPYIELLNFLYFFGGCCLIPLIISDLTGYEDYITPLCLVISLNLYCVIFLPIQEVKNSKYTKLPFFTRMKFCIFDTIKYKNKKYIIGSKLHTIVADITIYYILGGFILIPVAIYHLFDYNTGYYGFTIPFYFIVVINLARVFLFPVKKVEE